MNHTHVIKAHGYYMYTRNSFLILVVIIIMKEPQLFALLVFMYNSVPEL